MAKKQITNGDEIEQIKSELAETVNTKRERIFLLIMGAVLGSIPWVGGFLSASLNFKSSEEQVKNNQLYEQWFEEHEKKMKELFGTLASVLKRLDEFPEEINQRLESEEYLNIVRKAFRIWDTSDTLEKKEIIRKLVSNAGAYTLVDDDLIRLFLNWISYYHEVHFAVIRAIYHDEGITRYGIWQQLNGKEVQENSMEADVFKLLIRDLSTGGVIRQHRPVNYDGSFIKKTPAKKNLYSTNTMKSAFDDSDSYELTELGKKFVHYTMNELVPRVGGSNGEV
jgi:hypothetical protein